MKLFKHIYDNFASESDAQVFIDDNVILSSNIIAKRINSLCKYLHKSSLQFQDRVAIALDRGVDAMVAIYSVLLLKGCYVPIDLTNPSDRLKYIIENSSVNIVLGKGNKPMWCNVMWLDIEKIDIEEKISLLHELPCAEFSEDDLVAILYTSGSTGNPKGVAIPYKAIVAFVKWVGNVFGVNSSDKVASLAPFYFDLSLFDLFASAYYGASVFFIPQELIINPTKLSSWFEKNGITLWYTVPSMLKFWLLKGSIVKFRFVFRAVLFAGEKMQYKYIAQFSNSFRYVALYNLYGPTETNVCCYWRVDIQKIDPLADIPIGISACDAQLLLTEENELLVKGPTVSSGYVHGKNVEKITDCSGWYHTGDYCTLNNRNEYVFHNRLDRMMKCYGYRIEPGEIEKLACKFPDVEECLVVAIEDGFDNYKPALCFSAKNLINLREFRAYLNSGLPQYMRPFRTLQIDDLPKLSNGKTDALAIKKMLNK